MISLKNSSHYIIIILELRGNVMKQLTGDIAVTDTSTMH